MSVGCQGTSFNIFPKSPLVGFLGIIRSDNPVPPPPLRREKNACAFRDKCWHRHDLQIFVPVSIVVPW